MPKKNLTSFSPLIPSSSLLALTAMSTACLALAPPNLLVAHAQGQAPGEGAEAVPELKPDGSAPLKMADLDAATFNVWVDGAEVPAINARIKAPKDLIWTANSTPSFSNLIFGDSKSPGARHVRIGFLADVPVGSLFVRGGVQVSVLRAGAAYPGKLDDDSQWIQAQRVEKGQPTTEEPGRDALALWVLPPGTTTRALRFTHTARTTDDVYSGVLAGVKILPERLVNLAPQALAVTSSSTQQSGRLVDGQPNSWAAWANKERVAPVPPGGVPISAAKPAWVMLTWPEPVTLDALDLFWAGFSGATVESFAGPATVHPREAPAAQWKPVAKISGLKNGYPVQFWPNRINLPAPVTTRAIRIRITAPSDETHGHLKGITMDGQRVWLGEILALSNLGTKSLDAVRVAAKPEMPRPPIPIHFQLAAPGYVTLVIEGADGKRVRNLVSETRFPAGNNTVWWDGLDDLGRDRDAARHGVYKIPARFVTPGTYKVRGLVRGEIVPRYEFPVYNSGTPAWNTKDGTGGWLSNHTPPQAAMFVDAAKSPTGQALMYLGSYISEGRAGLAWVNMEGRKIGGQNWVGGVWTGAPYLARDDGPLAVAEHFGYAASVWSTAKGSARAELRITALTKGGDKGLVRWEFDPVNAKDHAAEISGLAVRNGILAVSLPGQKCLAFFDARDGKLLGQSRQEGLRGVVFDAQGRLLALRGKQLAAFPLPASWRGENLPEATPVVSAGLEDPRQIALDAQGQIYISDRGQSHQVKVFTSAGKPVRVVGKPGVPKAGPYDPLRMNNPDGMAVDNQGRLWVTENDFLPKRVSVWSPTGQLVKAFYGPAQYGGGGVIDPSDKTHFVYTEGPGAMEFKLDWAKGESTLTNVLYRPGPGDQPLAFRSAPPETPITFQGRQYFTNCFNSSPTNGHSTAFLFLKVNGVAKPIAAVGNARYWDALKTPAFASRVPAGIDLQKNDALFIWSDTDANGLVSPDEVVMRPGTVGGVTNLPDLSFCVARAEGKALRFRPASISPRGVPVYDVDKGEVLAEGVMPPRTSGGDQVLPGPDGWMIATLGMKPFEPESLTGARNGVPMWSYPSPWPGLHASHESPAPSFPGQLIGTTRLLGGLVPPRGEEKLPLWCVNGNMGNMYVFTMDGLFVATIFEDMRKGRLWTMPQGQRGMDLRGISLHDENFWPSIVGTPDGNTYLVDGANVCIVRLDGLETLKRLPESTVTVNAELLQQAQVYQVNLESQRQAQAGRGILEVALHSKTPVVDGELGEWGNAHWVEIDKSGVAAYFNSDSKPYDVTAALTIAGDRLYAAFRTNDARLLANSGQVPNALFKTGGALDLMLGTDATANPKRSAPVAGDIRLLVTMVKGKPAATLYRAVVPGTTDPVPFSSPWRTITLDKVEDVSADVQLAGKSGNYEFSIPLERLGLKAGPELAGLQLRGDVGILRGDGTQTTARVYWSNKATGITADVPSEAMLTPQLWGAVQVEARE